MRTDESEKEHVGQAVSRADRADFEVGELVETVELAGGRCSLRRGRASQVWDADISMPKTWREYVRNFNHRVSKIDICVELDHKNEEAAGWVERVYCCPCRFHSTLAYKPLPGWSVRRCSGRHEVARHLKVRRALRTLLIDGLSA